MKHIFILLATLLATPISVAAQDDGSPKEEKELKLFMTETPEKMSEDKIYEIVEQPPTFPEMVFTRYNVEKGLRENYELSGNEALKKWLSQNLRYPIEAEENGIQGMVLCSFVVERDGSITNAMVARSADPSLNKEALRLVKAMPKWIPGKQNGRPLRVKFTIPISFRLQ